MMLLALMPLRFACHGCYFIAIIIHATESSKGQRACKEGARERGREKKERKRLRERGVPGRKRWEPEAWERGGGIEGTREKKRETDRKSVRERVSTRKVLPDSDSWDCMSSN